MKALFLATKCSYLQRWIGGILADLCLHWQNNRCGLQEFGSRNLKGCEMSLHSYAWLFYRLYPTWCLTDANNWWNISSARLAPALETARTDFLFPHTFTVQICCMERSVLLPCHQNNWLSPPLWLRFLILYNPLAKLTTTLMGDYEAWLTVMLVEIFVISTHEVWLKGTTLFFSMCSAYLDPKQFRKRYSVLHQLLLWLFLSTGTHSGTLLMSGGKKQSKTRYVNSSQVVKATLSRFCITHSSLAGLRQQLLAGRLPSV